MGFRFLLPALLFVVITLDASQAGESFLISCEALQTRTQEYIESNMDLTLYERPATGLSMIFDYGTFTTASLPYRAVVEVEFGESSEEDVWVLYFLGEASSEKLNWVQDSVASDYTESTTQLETPAGQLTLACSFTWK